MQSYAQLRRFRGLRVLCETETPGHLLGQAVTLREPAVAWDGVVVVPPLALELGDSNCCRSCWSVAKAVWALERLLDCRAADREFRACEI